MLLTVFCLRRDRSELTFSLQVDADFELQNFRALCELESGIPAAESQIVYAERPLTDNNRSLASYGLKDGDVVILRQKETVEPRPSIRFPALPRIDFSSIAVPGTSAQQRQPPAQRLRPSPPDAPSFPQGLENPALLREMLLANPHELSLLKERNPPLAEALLSGDLDKFTRVLLEQQQDRARREQERIRLYSADPFDLEAQAKIEEDIRQQNIEENMTIAMEEAPESFGQVVMLYINCKVNGHPVKAFVDSGAQMTIMSQACAERCNIMRLVDRRWAGIAKGVGTQKIIGRVHLAQVQIEGDFLACSFSILEEQPMDMLLGLDMLKRHQCSIDLKKNVLVIGTTGSQTTFLPEGELPECARLAYGAGREDVRPEEIADQELAEAIQKSVEEAENSDKETTSLEMPSLPASDGFQNPVQSSGLSSKICNPTNQLLDRSVFAPASTCLSKPSLTEPTDPGAVKSIESSTECWITPEKDHPLVLQHLPNNSSLADNDRSLQTEEVNSCSPACLSQKTLQETFLADSLMECNTIEQGCGEEPLLKVTKENSLTDSPTKLGQIEDASLPSELKEPKQKNEFAINHQMCKEPEKFEHLEKQTDKTDPEHPGNIGGVEKPAVEEEGHPASQPGSLPAEMREGRLEKADLSCVKGCIQTSCHVHMEVDTTEHSVAEVHISASKQKWQAKNGRASDLNSDASSMEVESLKSATSLSDAVSTSDVLQSKSTSGIPTKCNELSSSTAEHSSSPSIIHQQDTDLGRHLEEPCFSLASALKELHKLLISCKGECKLLTSQVSQLEMVHKEQVQQKGFSEDEWIVSDPNGQQQSSSSFNVRYEGGKAEGSQPCDSGTENVGVGSVTHMESAPGEDASEIPEFSDNDSTAGTSDQQESSEQAKVLPEWFQCPPLEQNTVSSKPALGEGTSQDTQASLTKAPEGSSSSAPDGPAPWGGCEEPLPGPPAESTELPLVASPPAFPAADVDRILGAGFTTREALEALEQADGNADLALLILLAKSIVVPT
ncbi:regulatory solute carrier protein family 1 member 1 isoform X1 [Tympanuchus pallidicinctus]|uniref:regulatory solute carrier protein family 1 member 1 isoform X1 n=4 Tax=Tympanuchus pallidicinctus TaxID=109042 RepID=UPI0022871801|nr:regulatory solute carrier protein family 1 member 1 isoform X1 [Tympanuchus pallidicinctus]